MAEQKQDGRTDNVCHNILQAYYGSAINLTLSFLAGIAKRKMIGYKI